MKRRDDHKDDTDDHLDNLQCIPFPSFLPLSMVECGECGSCLQAEPAIYAARRLWHEGHFRCRGCTRVIHEDEQYALVVDENGCPHEETKNEPHSLCRKCFEQRSSVKCHGCNRGIVSTRFVEADGRMWHSYCFVCAFCQLEVSDSYVHDEDGRPLHKVCFLDRAMKAAIVDEGARLPI